VYHVATIDWNHSSLFVTIEMDILKGLKKGRAVLLMVGQPCRNRSWALLSLLASVAGGQCPPLFLYVLSIFWLMCSCPALVNGITTPAGLQCFERTPWAERKKIVRLSDYSCYWIRCLWICDKSEFLQLWHIVSGVSCQEID